MAQMMSNESLVSIINSTVKLLEEHNYYGLKKENVTIMKQNGVPAIKNTTCEIATKEDGHMIFKPHGHGDIHLLMNQVLFFYSFHISITFLRNGYKWARNISFSSKTQMDSLLMDMLLFWAYQRNLDMISTVWLLFVVQERKWEEFVDL